MTRYQYQFKPQLDFYPEVRKIPNPVEFFCPRKYEGYHVRGQSLFFSYPSHEDMRENTHWRFYQMQLVVLINDAVPWRGGSDNYRFGTIIIEQCSECGDFMLSRLGKKYCTLRVEGKDCGKKVWNRDYYERRDQRAKKVVKKEDTEEYQRFQRNIEHLKRLGLLKKP